MKIVIFGCGKVYKRYRSKIPSNHLVLGIVDNDKLTHGEIVDGYKKIFPNTRKCRSVTPLSLAIKKTNIKRSK